MRNLIYLTFILFVGCASTSTGKYYTLNNVAIEGYDLVSYFEKQPIPGNENHSYIYDDTTFLFSSNSNLELFKLNPLKYIPQYGGYCAYAMAQDGKAIKVDPETYEIRNEKLYLFYNQWGNNTLKSWLEESPEDLVTKANSNWKIYLSKNN
ncbi:hypothetical protein LY01_02699 [Nonlabens xylanidelens]|uniref:YHS domain-containing protein n=1 Tax=Nonlabens xylanidelens TaxID=191564 RepID=A0A2S6IFK2_9FLAO|nr:YHS domain-containing (seleno)protein [Nonlabens xylanidelens]PPK92994.1 hypothetical protein LY01_02699 [Nonlabens xylanidelens]PQJ18796.1 hypothetical protein BST94_07205 [Nonlabens xylanidelens]